MKTLINKFAAICFCFLLSLQMHAQDIIQTYLTGNPVVNEKWNEGINRKNNKPALADTIEIDIVNGLIEDFSYPGPYPDPGIWLDSFAYINRTYPYSPPTIGVATFDGLDKRGYPYDFTASQTSSRLADYLTSKPINLSKFSPADSLYFSFYYQPQGRGNAPALKDSLVLEFKAPGSTGWDHIWAKTGSALNMKDTTNWGFALIPVSNNYLKKGFQFRFKNYATVCGSLDHWHIDLVHLKPSSKKIMEDATFVYDHPSLLKNYFVMPWRQFTPTSVKDSVAFLIRNNYKDPKNINTFYQLKDENGNALVFKDNGNNNVKPFSLAGYSRVADALSQLPALTKTTSFFSKVYLTTAPDLVNKNNTVDYEQKFGNYFAYDDGTAESAFALNTLNAQFAMKFQLNVDDSLRYVDIYFNPILSDASKYTFNLKVWADGGGVPGAEIASSRTLTPRYSKAGLNTIIRYGLDAPLGLPAGTFYVGFLQNTNNSLGVGLDLNTNSQFSSFYNNGTGWNTSPIAGSAILHPVFGKDSTVMAISDILVQDKLIDVYPNPATTELNIRSGDRGPHKFNYWIVDAYGRLIENKTLITPAVVDISNLSKGIYFIRVSEENRTATTKFIKIE